MTPVTSPEPAQRLLTLREAARYLGLSTWTIRELIWRGEILRVRISRKILIDRDDLDRYIEARKEEVDRPRFDALRCSLPMSLPRKARKGGHR